MRLTRLLRRTFPGLAVLLFFALANALQGGQSRSSSRGATVEPSRQPPSVLSGPGQRNSQLLFITGVVVSEDGTPPSPGTRVECLCGGREKRTGSVDSRGYFSLQVGGNVRYSTLIPDAKEGDAGSVDIPTSRASRRVGLPPWADSMSTANLMSCELSAKLEGFRSNIMNLEGIQNLGQIDVGTIVLFPLAKVPGTLVSVTSLQAPKKARKALDRAKKSLQQKRLEKAEKELKTAVEAYPRYAAAWFELGQIYQHQRRIQDARDAYAKALAADRDFVRPYIELARLSGSEHKWQDVAEITDRALALDPLDFPEAYYLNSTAYYSLNRLDIAERSARKAQRLDPLHRLPAVYLILAEILERKHDFAGAVEQLQRYLQILPNAASAERVRSKIRALEESSDVLASEKPE